MNKPTVRQIEKKLINLIFGHDDAFAALLKGKWGTGKTYFWKKFEKTYLKNKKVAYVSLFGQQSVQDIKTEILLQIAPGLKRIDWVQDKVKHLKGAVKMDDTSVSLGGGALSAILSVLKTSDFKEVVICFDDFERISNKLDLKDVLGLISFLKEQKKCKVVMIVNDEELENADELNSQKIVGKLGDNEDVDLKQYTQQLSNVFNNYKEKTVDFEFRYKPSIADNFELVKDELKCFDSDVLYKLVVDYSLDNIRILKKVVNDLNEFSYLESHAYDKALLDGLMSYIFFVSTEMNKHEEYQKHQFGYTVHHARSCVDEYFEDSVVRKECLTEMLELASKDLSKYSIQESMRELYTAYSFNFSYDPQQFIEDAFKILTSEDEENVVQYLGFQNMKFYIDLFSDLNLEKKTTYEEYFVRVTGLYIDSIDFKQIERLIHREDGLAMKEYPELKDHIDRQKQKYYDKNNLTAKEVGELMEEPRDSRGWGNVHIEGLASITSDRYKELMLESTEFTQSAFDFVRWNNGFADQRPFGDACTNILNAFKSIGETDPRAKKLYEELEHVKIKESI